MTKSKTTSAASEARPAALGAREDPDAELVRLAGAGDRAAAAELVERHSTRIYRIAYRLLGDAGAAEDVAQETFLRLWRHAGSWKPGAAKFSTWLARVATNLCYDRLRRRREVNDEAPERADDAAGPAQLLFQTQAGAAVREAMADLPERQRTALTLCTFEEMTNIEAAAVMEVSVEALESLLSRGRRGLRQRLEPMREALTGNMKDVG